MAKEQKNKKYKKRLDKLADRVDKLTLDLEVFFEQTEEKLEKAQKTVTK